MKPKSRASGFTLIELIIVLVLMGVITALVVPRLTRSLSRMNAESSARQIASILRLARSQAVTEKIPYLAMFDMDTHTLSVVGYQIRKEEDLSDAEIKRPMGPSVYVLPDGIRFKEGVLSNGETITTGAFQMAFFPGGGTSGGEVGLDDNEGRSFSIVLDTITGSVKINEDRAITY